MTVEFSPIAMLSVFQHSYPMGSHFHGTLQELKDRLLPLDLDGDWEEQPNRVWKLRCKDRSGLLWSETKGTVWFDGPMASKSALSGKVESLLKNESVPHVDPNSKIFVVHGRDHVARD